MRTLTELKNDVKLAAKRVANAASDARYFAAKYFDAGYGCGDYSLAAYNAAKTKSEAADVRWNDAATVYEIAGVVYAAAVAKNND